MLIEKMLEYVSWEQVLVVLFVGLWALRTIQVFLLRFRMSRVRRDWGEEVDDLADELETVRMKAAAMRAKLHTVLDDDTYDTFMSECVDSIDE